MIVYGIKNCDTVKKMLTWLDSQSIAYEFHNYKTEGISKEKIQSWLKQVSLDKIFNKSSATWRSLSEEEKEKIQKSKTTAIKIMVAHPTIIKRPIIEDEKGDIIAIGFNKDQPLSIK